MKEPDHTHKLAYLGGLFSLAGFTAGVILAKLLG